MAYSRKNTSAAVNYAVFCLVAARKVMKVYAVDCAGQRGAIELSNSQADLTSCILYGNTAQVRRLDLVQHVYAAVPAAVWLFTLLSRILGSC